MRGAPYEQQTQAQYLARAYHAQETSIQPLYQPYHFFAVLLFRPQKEYPGLADLNSHLISFQVLRALGVLLASFGAVTSIRQYTVGIRPASEIT